MGSNFSLVAANLRGVDSWGVCVTIKFGVLLLSDELGDFSFFLLYITLLNFDATHGFLIA